MSNMSAKQERRETVYSSTSAAKRAMWNYYDKNIRPGIGNPLVSDDGTVLQWCANGKIRFMTVTKNAHREPILIKSWLD